MGPGVGARRVGELAAVAVGDGGAVGAGDCAGIWAVTLLSRTARGVPGRVVLAAD